MPLMFRKVVRLGPVRLNFGNRGLTSWSIRIWRWSWNSRTRTSRVDLPGPVSWKSSKR